MLRSLYNLVDVFWYCTVRAEGVINLLAVIVVSVAVDSVSAESGFIVFT